MAQLQGFCFCLFCLFFATGDKFITTASDDPSSVWQCQTKGHSTNLSKREEGGGFELPFDKHVNSAADNLSTSPPCIKILKQALSHGLGGGSLQVIHSFLPY